MARAGLGHGRKAVLAWGDTDLAALKVQLSRVAADGAASGRTTSGLVAGSDSYFEMLSFRDNLLLGVPRIGRRRIDARIKHVAEQLGLDRADRGSEASRFRCSLVRGLVIAPDQLSIVDPHLHLDDTGLSGLRLLIDDRCDAGQRTMLGLSTYSAPTVALASSLIVNRSNQEIFQGTPASIGPRLAELLFATSRRSLATATIRFAVELSSLATSVQQVAQGLAELLGEIYPNANVLVSLQDQGTSVVGFDGRDPRSQARLSAQLGAQMQATSARLSPNDVVIRALRAGEKLLGSIALARVPVRRSIPLDVALESITPAIGAYLDRRWQEQVQRDRTRVDAVQALVGGIAHDLNNMLQSVVGAADLVASQVVDPELRPTVGVLQTTAGDAATFVAKLLAFSRTSDLEIEPVDLHRAVAEAVDIVRRGVAKSMQVELVFDATDSTVVGSAVGLRNVMVNLVLNAVQATDDSEPNIEIWSRNVSSDEDDSRQLLIEITDHGRGVSADVRDQLFEPFVSERDGSMGTGLGLAVSSSILAEHGATIELLSTGATGSTFQIRLPIESGAVHLVRDSERPRRSQGEPLGVLLIDDEPVVLDVLSEMLGFLGYRTWSAPDGPSGIETYLRERDDIDVCIIDQLMPGMLGDQVIREIRKHSAHVAIIGLSGYRGEPAAQLAAVADIQLTKPISLDGIAAALASVVAQSTG